MFDSYGFQCRQISTGDSALFVAPPSRRHAARHSLGMGVYNERNLIRMIIWNFAGGKLRFSYWLPVVQITRYALPPSSSYSPPRPSSSHPPRSSSYLPRSSSCHQFCHRDTAARQILGSNTVLFHVHTESLDAGSSSPAP